MKNFKKVSIPTVLILFSLLLIACSLQATFAANQTVDQNLPSTPTVQNNISSAIGNATSGDTITINQGTYQGSGNNTNLNINKNLTFQGNGTVIIDAQKLSRIFTIGNGYNVTFINITFINANATGNGGAIYNNYAGTMITVINCSFTNNILMNTSTSDGRGAAIFNRGNNSIIINCIFNDNSGRNGAAIDNSGDNVTIIDSIFNNNRALVSGGAVFSSNEKLTVSGSVFTNNSCNGSTGALYSSGSNSIITNSIFINNSAGVSSGALRIAGSNVTVSNSIFINNSANNAGGGISSEAGGPHFIVNSTFINNSANVGGGVSMGRSNVTITDSSFINNSANVGGGVRGDTNNNVTINNSANIGGGVAQDNTSSTIIQQSQFTNNSADIGGGIFNNGNMTVTGNIMIGNSAGLGQMIYNNGTMGVLNLTYLSNSTVKTSKGSTVVIYAVLTDDMGNTVTGQDISFYVGGVFIANVTSIEGKANTTYLVTQDPVSVLPVTGDYAGHDGYSIVLKNGALLIPKIATDITIDVPKNLKVGKNTTLKSKLTDINGKPIANATVDFYVDDKKVGSAITDENGIAILNYTFTKAGNYNVQAKYAGNDTYLPSNATTQTKVSKIKTKITVDINGNEFTVTLTDEDGNPLAGKKVFLKDHNGKVLGWGITDENGQFTFTYNGNNVNFKASFNGDDVYEASSVEFSIGSENTTKSSNNPVGTATMKDTGIPIIAVILVLLASLGLFRIKKE